MPPYVPWPDMSAARCTRPVAAAAARTQLPALPGDVALGWHVARSLVEQEFDVWVVTDACSSRTERNRDAAFDRLAGAGAELVTTEMVAFEWLRTADHPAFRDVQAMIK